MIDITEAKKITNESDIPVLHAYTTSTFEKKNIDEETIEARGGGRTYNPDLPPCQNNILKSNNVNIDEPSFREKLLEASQFLEDHTYTLLREIVDNGWILVKKAPDQKKEAVTEYLGEEEEIDLIEENVWDPELETAFIDVVSKGMVIDTSYITQFEGEVFKIFTRNDEYRLYGNSSREITELYVNYRAQKDLYREEDGASYASAIVGFVTQYAEDESRVHRHKQDTIGAEDTIKRNCVVVQPMPHVRHTHGKPFLKKECQTALEKIYLRFYELLFIHKGGVNRTVGYPEGTNKSLKDNIVTATRRGMLSMGTVIGVQSNQNIRDLILVAESSIPDLNFEIINKHLSEEGKISRQKIEGAAESGALGGVAPEVNDREDLKVKKGYFPIVEKVIKDINDVFYGLDPEGYDVRFLPSMDQMMADMEKEQAEEEKQLNSKNKEEKKSPQYSRGESQTAKVSAHSVSDNYVVYEGNMFQAGVYQYPERGTAVVYTPDEIERMCKRDVRTGYMELNHSFDETNQGLSEGLGYYVTEGYDKKKEMDKTKFYIRKDQAHLIDPKNIQVSPYFYKRTRKDGSKDLYVKLCGIITKGRRTRASISGLSSSAIRVGNI